MASIKSLFEQFNKLPDSELLAPAPCDKEFKSLSELYGVDMPEEIQQIYSLTNGGFIRSGKNESWRIYSPRDILDAPEELNVDFIKIRKIPFIDCMDNNHICYDVSGKKYQMFNVVDEIVFDEMAMLIDFLSRIDSK